MKSEEILNDLIVRYPKLSICKEDIYKSYLLLVSTFSKHKKLLVAGNGGSAADSEHIVGELMKSFVLSRKMGDAERLAFEEIDEHIGHELSLKLQGAFPTISLVGHPALSTAYLNDVDPLVGFAQQVYGYGDCDDVFLGITTSGNSQNIIYAIVTAKAKGLKTISLTGRDGGLVKKYSDVAIIVPETETFKIQELHLPIYHCLCLMIENYFYGAEK